MIFTFDFTGKSGPYSVEQWKKDWPGCAQEDTDSLGLIQTSIMTTTIDIPEPLCVEQSFEELYEKNEFGFLVRKRPPGDTTVTTNAFVNQMREELGV